MALTAVVAPPRPAESPAPPASGKVPGTAPFLAGVLVTQIVNNALHLAQPLLIIKLSGGSLAAAAGVASAETAVHMSGTFFAGTPADRLGSRRLLILATALRGVCLAAIPLLWVCGKLTLATALVAYTADAVVRGFVDTADHALPLELAGTDPEALDRLNSGFELAFDLGGVIGPLLLGALLLDKKSLGVHAGIAAGFLLSAAVFSLVPRGRLESSGAGARRTAARRGGTREGLRAIWADRRLLLLSGGLALLNLFPLRKLITVFFAKAILHEAAAVGALGAAFGLGGALGAAFFAGRGRRLPGWAWVAAGAAGVLALACAWLPGSLAVMAAACFVFAFTNVGARLVLTRRIQEATPEHVIGGVTAVARSASNASSVALKGLMGAAFAVGAGATAAFTLGGAGLAVVAVLQLALALRLRRETRAP